MLQLGSEFAPFAESSSELRPQSEVLTTAELAECNCPDFCERDHDAD